MAFKNNTAGRLADVPTVKLRTYKQNYTTKSNSHFNRALLPMPIQVLDRIGIKPGKANRSGYWLLRCPLHKGGKETNPSLNLHQVTGHYRCHACGAKGGDILNFYQVVTGKSFKEAAQALGAWEVAYE